jgi:murein L,D-transpeptidase YcbB/YkuD
VKAWHCACTLHHVTAKKLLLILCPLLLLTACSFWNQPSRKEIDAIRAQINNQNVREIVREIYTQREFRPVWTARGRKLPQVTQFFQVVDDRSHGLHAEEFGVEALRQEKHKDLIQFDIDMTSSLARYAAALARKDVDLKATLMDAIQSGSIAQLPDRLAPVHVEYSRLRTALQNAAPDVRHTIELNMERWRKLPDDLGERHIRVNVPAFELEVHDRGQIPLKMRVVVGANDNKTPLFTSDMKYVVFSPYWNIPESILTKETLPRILKDPEYAKRQNLEVVKVSGKQIEIIDPDDIDWEKAEASEIQIRQRPGDGNSLGLVKFIFPNKDNVYLHDTPSDNLFDRLTRNFSHGCIRVEKPQELAEYVLRDQPEWTPERIRAAMHSGEEKHVSLKEPLPVHILYFTAWVDDGGTLQIAKDVYNYDKEIAP